MISSISKSASLARSSGRQLSSLSPPPSFFLSSPRSSRPFVASSSTSQLGRRSYATPPSRSAPSQGYTPRSLPSKLSSSSPSSSSSSSSPRPSSSRSFLPSPPAISVVPFSHTPSEARAFLDDRAPLHASYHFAGEALKRALGLKLKVKLVDFEAIYLPCWNVKAEIKVPFTCRSDFTSREIKISTENSFFPGTDETPFKWISCTPSLPTLPQTESFRPALLTQFGRKIRPLPFNLSPLVLPQLAKERLSYLNVGDHVVVDAAKDVEWTKLDATPLYLPFYVASYEHKKLDFKLFLEDTMEELKDASYSITYNFVPDLSPSAPHDTRSILRRWSVARTGKGRQTQKDPLGAQLPLLQLKTSVVGGRALDYRKDLAEAFEKEEGVRRKFEGWLDKPWEMEEVRVLSEKGVVEGEESGFVGRMGGRELR